MKSVVKLLKLENTKVVSVLRVPNLGKRAGWMCGGAQKVPGVGIKDVPCTAERSTVTQWLPTLGKQ
jgi:hypothetical protein